MKTNPPLLDALKQSDVFHGLDQPQYEAVVLVKHETTEKSCRGKSCARVLFGNDAYR